MKRPLLVLLLVALAGGLAFVSTYWLVARSHRPVDAADVGELAWVRREFNLSDAQFARVAALHESYKPACGTLCRRIADQNQRLRDAVGQTNTLTGEIRALVAETGRARDECRQAMLAHLFAVAREMPPTEGARYLQIMLGSTCVLQDARTIGNIVPNSEAPPHAHHE